MVRWRRIDPVRIIDQRFGVACWQSVVSNDLVEPGFSHIPGHPRHPTRDSQVPRQSGDRGFQKNVANTLAAHGAGLPAETPVEVWFHDEARIGQKNRPARIRASKGTRPRLPAGQRYQNTCLFGAICPKRGTGAALVLPAANTQAMQLHLDGIGKYVAGKAHAVVLMDRAHGSGSWIGLMDRAGWHTTGKPSIPGNIPRNIPIPGTSQLSCCHQNRRNRTRSKTYGSTCLPTGSPTGPSKTTTQSSMQRAMHRTIPLINRKPSLQSE